MRSTTVLNTYPSREIRLFVSGTFVDMQAERDYLVKHIFPEFKQLCRERGISCTEVDLRWGITQNEARRGKVVGFCLDEVLGRHSYVIGLIGERYGWRPSVEDIDFESEVGERYPWVRESVAQELSLTEIETLEAAKHHPELNDRLRFYVKRDSIPRDIPLPESVQDDLRRLDSFRDRIGVAGVPVRAGFESPEHLGEWVRQDLIALLDSIGSAGFHTSWLERERTDHEGFAATRRRAYVENKKILSRLDRYVEEGEWLGTGESVADESGPRSLPLVVTGDSGAGKSALLAHWSDQFRKKNPGVFLVTHYVGATGSSTDFVGLLRRIMLEIRDRYGISEEPPADPDRIVSDFPQWLAYAAGEPLVLVLDALNQLEPRPDHLTKLRWLPEDFLPHVRIILSTTDGLLLEAMSSRKWPELQVEPLNEQERREVARRFLGDYSKRLDKSQLRRLAGDVKSANPLYLRTSLEELRVFGKFEELNQRIDYYLGADDLNSLFDRVLERIESDYGRELVGAAMQLLWGSRHGLSEEELCSLTGADRDELAKLLRALDYHLMRREGLLTFFHDHLRRAARARYVPNEEAERKTHRILASYFAEKSLGSRRLEEEPWQWRAAEAWDELEASLMNIPLICGLCRDDKKFEALRYWQALPQSGGPRIGERYRESLSRLETSTRMKLSEHIELLDTLGGFLFECAEYDDAEALYRREVELRQNGDADGEESQIRVLTKLGSVLQVKGDYEDGETILRQALKLTEEVYGPDHIETANVLETLATLLYTMRHAVEAEILCERGLRIRESLLGPEHVDSLTSRSTLGAVKLAKGDSDGATQILKDALTLSERALGQEHPMTAICLNNLAVAYQHEKNYEAALPLLQRAIAINMGIYGAQHPQTAANIANLAYFERLAGRIDEAEAHYRQAIDISIAVFGKDHSSIADYMRNLGSLLRAKGELDEAEDAYRAALSICENVFGEDHVTSHRQRLNIANIHLDRAEYQEALPILRHSIPALRRALGAGHPVITRYLIHLEGISKDLIDEIPEAEPTVSDGEIR